MKTSNFKNISLLIVLVLIVWSGVGCSSQKQQEVTEKGEYQVVNTFPLEQVSPGKINTMKFIKGEIKAAPTGNYVLIGSEKGYLRLLDLAKQKILWETPLGLGTISAIEFSADGKQALVGENSPDGYLYCLSIPEGKVLWKFRTAGDVGASLREKSLPQVTKIVVKDQWAYVTVTRTAKQKGEAQYVSRLYCLQLASGKIAWTFPATGNADANLNWVAVSPTTGQVAFSTMNYSEGGIKYNSLIYCLAEKTGKLLWEKKVEPIEPYKITTVRYGPNFSPDGKFLTFFASDGRAFCLDSQGQLLWQEAISTPKNIGGFYIGASGRYSYPLEEKIIFSTMNTTNVQNRQEEPPVEHPNSDSLFFYDYQGKLLQKFAAKGAVGELSFDREKKLVLVPVGRNVRTMDVEVHGVYLLNGEKASYHYTSQGPIIAAVLSPAGEYITALEGPVLLEDGVTVLGKYQVILLKKCSKK